MTEKLIFNLIVNERSDEVANVNEHFPTLVLENYALTDRDIYDWPRHNLTLEGVSVIEINAFEFTRDIFSPKNDKNNVVEKGQ